MSLASRTVLTLRLALPLYVASVVLAAGPTVIGMMGLAMVAADRPWRAELLGPNWLNLLMELTATTIYEGGNRGVSLMVLAGVLLVPLALLLQMVVYSFFAGGILEQLAAAPGESPPFWRSCRRWFWRSLRLSVLGSVIVVAVAGLVGVIANTGDGVIGPDQSVVLQLVVQALVPGWLELGRAVMVQQARRSAVRALAAAARAFGRPVVLVTWLLLALPSAGLLVASGLPPAISDPFALSSVFQALAFGQILAFLSAWTKVVRLVVALYLAQGVRAASPLRPASVPPA